MKKNNSTNNKNWMLIDAISNHRQVSNGNWKKHESAMKLIRGGSVIHNKKSLIKPDSVVSKGLRYRLEKKSDSISLSRSFTDSNLGFKYHGTKVSSAFWSNWTDQVVSSRGKSFSFEKGRFYGFYNHKVLSRLALRRYYRIKNKHIKAMQNNGKNLPLTSGYRDILYKNMERRIDVSLVRLGYSLDLVQARKLIKKGGVMIDKKVVRYPYKLMEAGSIISVVSEKLPFMLMEREHLKHFPATWRTYTKPKSRAYGRYRRATMGWSHWLKKYVDHKNRDTLMEDIHREGDFRVEGSRFVNPNYEGGSTKKASLIWKRYMFFKTLRRKLVWKSGGFLKKINKRSFKMPVLNLTSNYTYVDVNKALFTHYHSNKGICVPSNLALGN